MKYDAESLMENALEDFMNRMDPDEQEQEEKYRRYEQDIDGFYGDAYLAVCAIKRICEYADGIPDLLTDLQRIAIGTAWQALNEVLPKEAPDHQNERPF